MRRFHWLQAVAVLSFLAGAVAGALLVTYQGLIPIGGHGDCTRPIGSSGGCFGIGYPYWWVGVLVWMVAVVGAVVLWSVGMALRGQRVSGEAKAMALS